jgi:hypothetical protein
MLETKPSAAAQHRLDRAGWARRADVHLRAKYPNLITRIFEVTPDAFVIAFDHALQDENSIDVNEIRPVTLRLTLANEIPAAYSREIQPIADADLARHYEGFPFTVGQLANLVIARFPDLPIAAVYDNGPPMVTTIELTSGISPKQNENLLAFCEGLCAPAEFKSVVSGRSIAEAQAALKPKVPIPQLFQSDALTVDAYRLRPKAPSFVRTDEDYWFSNLDAIYAGRIVVDRMPGISEGDTRCFVDATIGDHINFRQLLTYYDTIYFSPPLMEGHEAFLANQALADDDLLQLVESGRLRVLLTQKEERLNIPFLEAALERSPDAIIGRRTAAAMIAADLVQTTNKYRLNDPDNFAAIGQFAQLIAERVGLPPTHILRQMLWPVEARRGTVAALFNGGTKGMISSGVAENISEIIQKKTGKDASFDLMMLSEKVHIAHAINATAFPMHQELLPWVAVSNAMADRLNFYRSFDTEIAAAWVGNVERKEQGKRILPPLDLLSFDANAPILDILEATNRVGMRNRARGLFSRLAEMDEPAREAEIKEINAALRKFGKPAGIISLDNVDTAAALASLAWTFAYPPVMGLYHVGTQLIDLASRIPAVEKFVEDVRNDLFPKGAKKRELDFLSRISRVATLKRKIVS